MVGILLDELGERLFVDPPDIRRDVVERLVSPQLLARCRPTALVGQRFLGIVALEGERRARVAP